MKRFRSQAPSFDEIASTLVWPALLRTARLALRPARLGLAGVLLVILGLLVHLPSLWLGAGEGPAPTLANLGSEALDRFRSGVVRLDLTLALDALADLTLGAPLQSLRNNPWSTLAIALPALAACGVLGGAISRLTAEEHALFVRSPWTSGLGIALSRGVSLALVLIAPVALLAIVCALLAGAGYLLLSFPVADVVGGVLYGGAMLVGVLVVVFGLALLLGAPMLVPGVVCEGTDAIDSVQRTIAYALTKPARLVAYLAVLLVQLFVVVSVLEVVFGAGQRLTAATTTALISEPRRERLERAARGEPAPPAPPRDDAAPPRVGASRFLRFWAAIPSLAIGSYVMSFWFTGGTLLYLTMRRVCDGQDAQELWRPGATPGLASVDVEPHAESDDDD
ncbi:MAG: hypothetical protein SFY69_00095 [Planctomycetota bacterium]|nr:hypothetical protein [Planctomycetota bacterium]